MKCGGRTPNGEPCRAPVADGATFCFWHRPDAVNLRREAGAKGGRNRRPMAAPLADDFDGLDLRTAAGLAGAVAAGIRRLGALPFSVQVAHALAALTNTQRATLETGELERRITALEARTTLRRA